MSSLIVELEFTFVDMHPTDILAALRRTFLKTCLPLIFFGCTHFQNANANESNAPEIVGNWTAEARFFDREVRNKVGQLEARLVIDPDLTLKGQFGNSEMTPTRPKIKTSTQLQYHVLLKQSLPSFPEFRNPHLVVIVTLKGLQPIDADFHLKSRFGFDPKMRVGHFDIKH